MNKIAMALITATMLMMSSGSLACDLIYEVFSDDLVSELCVTIE